MVSGCTFKSLVHFELISVSGVYVSLISVSDFCETCALPRLDCFQLPKCGTRPQSPDSAHPP